MKKRLVIKVGGAVLTEKNHIAKERMLNLVSLIVSAESFLLKGKHTLDTLFVSE